MLLVPLITVLIVGLILSGCAKPAPAPAPAPVEPIKIGALAALTGPMALDALDSIRGLELKLDEVGYEVAGRKIEYTKEDYATDPVKAVDKARKLVEADKVDVILGPLFAPAGLSVANYLTESRTPNIPFMMMPHETVEFGGGNVFMPFGTHRGTSYPLGLYAYDELGYRTVNVIHFDFVGGEVFCGSFINAFESRGGVVVQRQRPPEGTMDFSAYLTGMKEADCTIFFVYGDFVPAFLKQYSDYGLKMPLLIPLTDPAGEVMLAEAGDISVGMIGSDLYSPLIDTEMNRRFVDAYVKKYGHYPRGGSAGAYIGATIFLEAVKATGGDTSHEKIIEALGKLKVDTVTAPFSFTPKGIGIGNLYILEVVKIGDRYAWKPIHTYDQIVLDAPE